MQIKRRFFLGALAFVCASLLHLTPALAQEFLPLDPPQPTENAAKIEVIEFFSYGCPHCNEFAPLLEKWRAKQAKDVDFKRIPVSFGRAQWFNLGKLYYALEAGGELARVDGAVFNAIHGQNIPLGDDKGIIEWVGKQPSVDGKKFGEVYNSFSIAARMKRAEQLAPAYKVDGVPKVIVDGRYVIQGKDFADILVNTSKAIDKARAEHSKKK